MKLKYFLVVAALFSLQFTTLADDHSNHGGEHKHWGYKGDVSPEHWYELDPSYAISKDGFFQSPIDIKTSGSTASAKVKAPVFHYTSTLFGIENNGHTIQLDPLIKNDYVSLNYITLDGVDFFVQQAHFHSPSEHTINGKVYDIELHIVHKNSKGELAVVGIMIENGSENRILADAFGHLPKENTKGKIINLDKLINLGDILPLHSAIYRYDGSLTTPPCSEGVYWSIFGDDAITMSNTQINAFKALYKGNNRPCQPLNNRVINKTR
jgi:carbonic anhydrase